MSDPDSPEDDSISGKDSISRDDVAHVGALARIELSEDDIDHFADHLGKVLDHARELEQLDLDDVEATTHAYALVNVLREDEVVMTLDRDEVLAEAPEAEDGQFRVPSILGEAP
jgi:aspartyl-tRNA(Asn)/glutamyl-tRNA(Gln) amidotransferase subunit C